MERNTFFIQREKRNTLECEEIRVPLHNRCVPEKGDIESDGEVRTEGNFGISVTSEKKDDDSDEKKNGKKAWGTPKAIASPCIEMMRTPKHTQSLLSCSIIQNTCNFFWVLTEKSLKEKL